MSDSERRQSNRLNLVGLDRITIRCPDGTGANCLILDISPFGMKLEVTSAVTAEDLTTGAPIQVVDCPRPLNNLLGGVECHVQWKRRNHCGVSFSEALQLTLGEIGEAAEYVAY
jgi:hypothetical protein